VAPLLLACVALTDEPWSGVAVVAAPDVEREEGLEHGSYVLLVFALPLLGGALLEAAITLSEGQRCAPSSRRSKGAREARGDASAGSWRSPAWMQEKIRRNQR
jgi:hypothetical protein